MTELESGTDSSGQVSKKLVQKRGVLLKAWRKLKQNRSEFRTQAGNNPLENVQELCAISKLSDMGNLLWRLKPESKMLWSRAIPGFNRLAIRNAIEGVVDLASGKSFRVER